ncbi:hypothetical protein LCGC14_2989170 [marine sediment metagenome]|uniref:Uncharacterized protein n=1 Tax=marine sediment metagenome TaxID=412755 RepID=A0A0F8ZVF7_9ZZZZ
MFWRKNDTEETIKKTVERILRSVLFNAETTLGKIKTIADLNQEVHGLREAAETAKIEKGRVDEERAKKDREIEHKVGLERTRQKFETEQAKREATVTVREENLTADRKRFEEQMDFQNERFTEEVTYLKDMVGQVLKRLPDASIYTEVKSG